MGSGIRYTPEFKVEAVRLATESSRSNKDVALELGINPDTLRVWISRSKLSAMDDDQIEQSELARRVHQLERQVKALENENAFLKKAAAFFAAEPHKNGTR